MERKKKIGGSKPAEEVLRDQNEELEAAVEELRISEEELASQLEELQQSRDALAATKQLYQELFENVNVGILRSTPGPEGSFIDMNPAMVKLFEADSREQLMALHPSAIYWDASQRKVINDAIVAKGFAKEEIRFKTLKGKPLWCHINSVKKTDASGKVYFDSTIEDFTERKRAEEELKESEAKFKRLYDSNVIGVIFWDTAGNISQANSEFLRIVGYTEEEVLSGKVRWKDMTPPEYAPLDEKAIKEMTETGISAPFEKEYIRKDGSRVPIRLNAAFLKGEKDIGICFIQDITERKRAEEALRQSEEKYRLLSEFTWDWVYWLDNDHRFVYCSPSCERITGYAAEEFLRDPALLMGIVHPEDRALMAEHRKAFHSSAVHGELEFRIVRRDGEVRWIEHVCKPIVTADGGSLGRRSGNRDITKSKQAEEAIKRYAADLKRSNEELQQFAYVASHDLQEPLRAVASFTQLLSERYKGRLDKNADEFIAFAVDGAHRMQALINDLLSYSRLETRGKPPEPTDSHDALGQALANLGTAIRESGTLVTNDDLPLVKADEGQLVQLFQNLVGNAIKFRGQEPPRVHVSALPRGGEWLFTVRDNGIGIAKEYHERIFSIFQRLHSREEYPGTGIGLALCKRIVERHGGTIRVESEPDSGSNFFFTLPKP
jgi:PAS domain S-box-containing protein